MGQLFDPDDVFDADYLHFARDALGDERSDEDVGIVLSRAGLVPGARVLDAPCGNGRLAVRLAERGLHVTGIDRAPALLADARALAASRDATLELLSGDLRDLPADGPFDAAICWFTSFGYFDDAGNRRVLDEFRRVLRPGGTLLVETLNHDGFVRTFTEAPEAVVVEVDGDLLVDRSTFDVDAGRLVCRRVGVRGGVARTTSFAIRLLTIPEWRTWLGDAGFSEVEVTDRAGGAPELSTWRVVVRAC